MSNKFNYLILVLFILLSCKEKSDKSKTVTKEYFYKVSYTNNNRVDYSFRKYEYANDTLKEKVIRFNSLGELISNDGDGGFYLKTTKGLFLLQGKKNKPQVGGLVYTTKVEDSCVEYFHPFYHQIKNCYKGLSINREYIFNSIQQAIDGFNYDVYLSNDYTLVKKTSNSVLSNFKEEIRIDKSEVPNVVLKNIN